MSVKWGVLGTAGIATGCTIPGMQLAEDVELYAIAGRDEKKVKDYQERFGFQKAYIGYDTLLADPEVQAVYVPLPNHLHCEWVVKALKAGKHVLCEKPLALSAEQMETMFAAAKENNVLLMEAYAYLHSPYVKALKDVVKSGVLGDIRYIETAFLTQGYKEDIRIHKHTGGGALYDLGCYCTTMILSLIDSEPAWIKADAEFNDDGVDIFTAALLKFENGVRASFNVGMILGDDTGDRMDRLYIQGSRGYLRSNVEYNQAGELSFEVVSDGQKTVHTVSAPQNYSLETAQLSRCILHGEQPYVTPEFSLRNAKLLDRLLKETGY